MKSLEGIITWNRLRKSLQNALVMPYTPSETSTWSPACVESSMSWVQEKMSWVKEKGSQHDPSFKKRAQVVSFLSARHLNPLHSQCGASILLGILIYQRGFAVLPNPCRHQAKESPVWLVTAALYYRVSSLIRNSHPR